jgi:hypothetical protein
MNDRSEISVAGARLVSVQRNAEVEGAVNFYTYFLYQPIHPHIQGLFGLGDLTVRQVLFVTVCKNS